MGISTSIVGIKPADEKWKQMKAAYDACEAAGIRVPSEIWDFFDNEEPDELGVVVYKGKLGDAVQSLRSESSAGYVVDLTKLPPDIKLLKFENSW